MESCCASPSRLAEPIDVDDLALLCKALGHPARVRLLRHLADFGACYFGSLADVIGLAPSTTSQHVSILKEAGLICGSADAARVCYCVNPARLDQLKTLISKL
jgi:ArsR family transcriptional regulator